MVFNRLYLILVIKNKFLVLYNKLMTIQTQTLENTNVETLVKPKRAYIKKKQIGKIMM